MHLSEDNGKDKYDCRKCGACCVRYCYDANNLCMSLDEEDVLHIPRSRLIDFYGAWRLKAVKRGKKPSRCVYLKGEVGKKVACGLQAHKPVGCRGFPVGCPGCDGSREDVLTVAQRQRAINK